MRAGLFDIIDADREKFPEIENHLSFEPYLRYLRARLDKEHSLKKSFFEDILNKFNQAFERYGILTNENFLNFEQELRSIHATLNPPLEEEENFWALGYPLGQKICFGTENFYDLLQHNKCQTHLSVKSSISYIPGDSSPKARMLYSFIAERIYGLSSSRNFELIHSFTDYSGLQKYYRINIDHSFVDVKVRGELPVIDRIKIRDEFLKTLDLGLLKTVLPLEQIRLEGFSVLTVQDITSEQALENIKNIIINGVEGQDSYSQVLMALKNLAGKSAIEFTLAPLLKLNGRVVFDSTKGHASIGLDLLTNNQTSEIGIKETLDEFIKKPTILIFNREEGIQSKKMSSFQQGLVALDIENYALIPIFHNIEMVGVIEVFTKEKGVLDDQVLSRVFSANTLLAQLLKDEALRFETKINEVIRDKFTSLQSAVQWKFNEEAWKYLQGIEEDKPKPNIGEIKFEKVYPLYGAIDIRSSTVERNKAAYQDIILHLELLENVLLKLKDLTNVVILDEIIFNCRRWSKEIVEELMDAYQIDLNEFFNHDVTNILSYFKENSQASHHIIAEYEKAIHPINGLVYKNRNALEGSIQLINTGINNYLELFDKELQSSYPCYFEKIRSDGVEYDIYIGQSISPDKNFNEVYLKNIRLWQLTSMAAVARVTHKLLHQMEKRLYTTQLIFVNASPIDIHFRTDERRFDVEGAYNIRYQIIKKRIDKVNIKDTGERLTQPGKIALVYFTEREIKEYLGYIDYLQEKGTLLNDLEELELEELQGVKGLKALRVGVNLI